MLRVLSNLEPEGLSLAQLAERTRIPAPTMARLIKTAQFAGFIERLPNNTYVPGAAFISVAITLDRRALWRRIIDEEMTAIRDRVDETVGLYVRKGLERCCVYSVESRQAIRRGQSVGQRLPFYTGASGRVFLAFGNTDELLRLVPQREVTPIGRIITADDLRAESAETRRNGFAYYRGYVNTDAWGLAAPVMVNDVLYGTLVVSAPVTRMEELHVNRCRSACLMAARQIGERLSYTLGYENLSEMPEP